MAYGDIDFNDSLFPTDRVPISTVSHAVVIRNSGSSVDFRSDSLDLDKVVGTKAYKNAGVYVGVQGDILVELSSSPLIKSGSTTADTTNKLVDAGFSGGLYDVQVGDRVLNVTDGTQAFVSAVDSDTTLSLVTAPGGASNADIFDGSSSAENYEIYRPILFQQIAAGSFLPIKVNRIYSSLTSADDIIALY
tara:strand:- start:197 stop:769 length:573 start_codon:yes stop_codon:yes gene_type:complete